MGLLLPCCRALPWSGHFWVRPAAVQSEHSGNGLREPHKLHWTLWASLPLRPLCPAALSFWQAALWALTSGPRLFRVQARAQTWSAGSALALQPPAAVPYSERALGSSSCPVGGTGPACLVRLTWTHNPPPPRALGSRDPRRLWPHRSTSHGGCCFSRSDLGTRVLRTCLPVLGPFSAPCSLLQHELSASCPGFQLFLEFWGEGRLLQPFFHLSHSTCCVPLASF